MHMSILVYTYTIEKVGVSSSLVTVVQLVKAKVGRGFVKYSRGTRGYAPLKLRELNTKP